MADSKILSEPNGTKEISTLVIGRFQVPGFSAYSSYYKCNVLLKVAADADEQKARIQAKEQGVRCVQARIASDAPNYSYREVHCGTAGLPKSYKADKAIEVPFIETK